MGEMHGLRDLADNPRRISGWDATSLRDHGGECVPLDELAQDVGRAVKLADVINGYNRRMIEAGGMAGRTEETVHGFAVERVNAAEDLECRNPVQSDVANFEDDSHPTAAKPLDDFEITQLAWHQ